MTGNRVFAIYQIVLGWKTYEYYYETDELPNPRLTKPKKKMVLTWKFGPLFPTANDFLWVGIDYIGNRLQETQPNQTLRKHPNIKPVWCLI